MDAKEPRLSEAKQKLLEIQRRRGGFAASPSASAELKCRAQEIPAPLSLAQEQVWRLDQTAGKLAPLHNESITIHRHGPCNPLALEKSLAEIVRRHEIWRTTFETVAGRLVQMVHPAPATFQLPLSDLRALPAGEREKKALDLATQEARQPFDLQRGPLFRTRLITLDDAQHRLYLTAHRALLTGSLSSIFFPSS